MVQETKSRIAWLDTVRVIAILMVIFMHAPIPGRNLESSYLLGALSYLTFPCIGLFFMASGALLLPVKMPLKVFLKRRFSRILFPTIIWSLFYIAVKFFYNETDLYGAGKLILQIPFKAVEGVLWFMYTLTSLYLFAPILSKWLETAPKKEMEYFLVLWLAVMSFPYVNAFVQMRESDYHVLSTFSGFLGYMVFGFYLKQFPLNLSLLKNKLKMAGGILIFSIVLPLLFYVIPIKSFDPGTVLYNYLSISIVIMSAGWFVFIQNTQKLHSNKRFANVMKELSVMSFGIYLAHIFVMRRLIWNWIPVGALPLWVEITIVSLATLLLTYILIKIISIFPFRKYLIG